MPSMTEQWVASLSEDHQEPARQLSGAIVLAGRWLARLIQEKGLDEAGIEFRACTVQLMRSQLSVAAEHIDLERMGTAIREDLTRHLGDQDAEMVSAVLARELLLSETSVEARADGAAPAASAAGDP